MIKKTIGRVLLTFGIGLAAGNALADDIDIYSGNSAITPGAPNVLIVLDNTANWSQNSRSSMR